MHPSSAPSPVYPKFSPDDAKNLVIFPRTAIPIRFHFTFSPPGTNGREASAPPGALIEAWPSLWPLPRSGPVGAAFVCDGVRHGTVMTSVPLI